MKTRFLERRKLAKLAVIIVSVPAVLIPEYLSYRNKAMDRLYAEAAGYPPYFRTSNESVAAAKKLATYSGGRATSLLLNIALSENPFAPQAREEAFRALYERNDPQVGVGLANLLQPYQGLGTRRNAAAALQHLPCNGECVRSVLHYFERVWRGDPNYEDLWTDPSPDGESFALSVRKDQKQLYSNLYSVLERERAGTLANLAEVYGLGSADPSKFALDLVPRLGLHEACPLLLESDNLIKPRTPETFKAPRQELQAALASLNCR